MPINLSIPSLICQYNMIVYNFPGFVVIGETITRVGTLSAQYKTSLLFSFSEIQIPWVYFFSQTAFSMAPMVAVLLKYTYASFTFLSSARLSAIFLRTLSL